MKLFARLNKERQNHPLCHSRPPLLAPYLAMVRGSFPSSFCHSRGGGNLRLSADKLQRESLQRVNSDGNLRNRHEVRRASLGIGQKGQSLVEVIVACGILGIVMAAMMSIAVASRNLLYQSEEQTKATALAQEGIEIVKHQRDIGCGWDNVKSSVGDGNNSFVIQGDKEPGDNETLEPGAIDDTTQIENFTDFRRLIQIYDLGSYTATELGSTAFQLDTGNPDNNYDTRDKYYFIKVKIQKNGVDLSKTSTIMSKE